MGSLKKMIVMKLFLLFNLILIVYPMTGGSTGSEDRIILHIHQDNPEDTGAAINEVEAAGDETSSWTQSWTEDPSEPKQTWTDRPSWTKRPNWKTTMSWKTRRPEWTTRPSYPKRPECGKSKYGDTYGRCEDCERADCERSENCAWDYTITRNRNGLCRLKECGSWLTPCEKCGHTECEKSGYCYFDYGDYGLGVCKIKECGKHGQCEDCGQKECELSGKCQWKYIGTKWQSDFGVCKPIGKCGEYPRECEDCKEKDCEEAGKCTWVAMRPWGTCVKQVKEGRCGWDCSKCKYKYVCDRDHECRWNKWGKDGSKCEKALRTFPGGK